MNIIIGADCVPTDVNEEYFISNNLDKLIGEEIINIFEKSNFRILNLESPLTDSKITINKNGPCLKARPQCINSLKKMQIDLLSISNNHIMDYGICGLNDTINTIKNNEINYVGAGNNLNEACEPFIFEIDNKKIAVISVTEHEFSCATDTYPGAAPFDYINTIHIIKKTKKIVDFLIILYHGGKEEYRFPIPFLRNTCKNLVDFGANLIICQHSHCIGCREIYKNGTIIYGQGNFLFNECNNEYWNTGLLINLLDDFKVDYIPICKTDCGTRLATPFEKKKILSDFFSRSNILLNEFEYKKQYFEYMTSILNDYLIKIIGRDKKISFRILNKITNGKYKKYYIEKKCNKMYLTRLLNFIDCESHRELLIDGLKLRLSDKASDVK